MPEHIFVYIFVFGCAALVIICFIRCFNIPFDRRHIRDLRDIQAIQQREEEIDELGRQREIREYFVRANLERLELASSLENYVRYIRSVVAEQERLEKIKEAEEGQIKDDDVIIFINPGNTKPTLGRRIRD